MIVWGIAAMHHGSIRKTDDLDVCPRWSRENLDRLGAALSELGAELAVAPGETVPVPVIDGVLLSRMEIGRYDAAVWLRGERGGLVWRTASSRGIKPRERGRA